MSDTSRRKILKSIAASSGAVIAGKSLPDSWSKPVVDSVMLPAHAQTSLPQNFSQTLTQTVVFLDPTVLTFDFNISGFTPSGDGSITVTAFSDLGNASGAENTDEFITVAAGVNPIGDLFAPTGGVQCDFGAGISGPETLPISLAQLQAAISGTTISIQLTPSADVDLSRCGAGDQIVTLEFPA